MFQEKEAGTARGAHDADASHPKRPAEASFPVFWVSDSPSFPSVPAALDLCDMHNELTYDEIAFSYSPQVLHRGRPHVGIVGQDRALRALRSALRTNKPGYNIFICGDFGTGRLSAIRSEVSSVIGDRRFIRDVMYVFNPADATQPVPVMEKIEQLTDGKMCDLTINNVNIPDTEMTSILCTKNDGLVYFFSMATSFTKAALGAEGVGSDVTMIIGNGYTKGHAEITLQILRESEKLRKIFTELYA